MLAYVNTKSQAVEELLATGRIDDARAQLEQLAAAARSLYVDVRETILGLRGPIPAEHGLIEALSGYTGRFAEASKLAVVFEASDAARSARASAEVEAEVFRIVQEALTNVRKHAAARRVTVRWMLPTAACSSTSPTTGVGSTARSSRATGRTTG